MSKTRAIVHNLTIQGRPLAHARALANTIRGQRVAILCGNELAAVTAREAIARAESIAVPLHPQSSEAEIATMLTTGYVQEILTTAALARLAERASKRASASIVVRVIDDINDIVYATDTQPDSRPHTPPNMPPIGGTLLYTSGTTGQRKACLRTAQSERARAKELATTYAMTSGDVHLIACPLSHSAPGIFLRAARSVGAQTVLQSRFDPEAFLDAVQRYRASLFFLVPTQWKRLLALPHAIRRQFDTSSVRIALTAGAPIPPQCKDEITAWLGPVLWEFYGSTETGTISVIGPREAVTHPGSVGKPLEGVEIHLEPDASGLDEFYVRSPTCMTGYLNETPAEGQSQAIPAGFISVGDLGRVDDDGYLYLIDRKGDLIISGGVNIYPAEVEAALLSHPQVTEAIVFGVDHADWGQAVAACIAGPSEPTREDIYRHLRELIAPYKIPKALAVVDVSDIPVGASGKLLRRHAAARFASDPVLRWRDRPW